MDMNIAQVLLSLHAVTQADDVHYKLNNGIIILTCLFMFLAIVVACLIALMCNLDKRVSKLQRRLRQGGTTSLPSSETEDQPERSEGGLKG